MKLNEINNVHVNWFTWNKHKLGSNLHEINTMWSDFHDINTQCINLHEINTMWTDLHEINTHWFT